MRSRKFATIWREMAAVLDIEPIQLELWHRDPNHRTVWLRDSDWTNDYDKWMAKDDDEKAFYPKMALKNTDGWERKRYGISEYPMFGSEEQFHNFEFKINEDGVSADAVYKWCCSVVGFDIVEMPNNCGMSCLTDLQARNFHERKGLGTLAVEFAERMSIHSNYHYICATCVANAFKDNSKNEPGINWSREQEEPMVKIFEKRGWIRSAEFINPNSTNIIALYYKELAQ